MVRYHNVNCLCTHIEDRDMQTLHADCLSRPTDRDRMTTWT